MQFAGNEENIYYSLGVEIENHLTTYYSWLDGLVFGK